MGQQLGFVNEALGLALAAHVYRLQAKQALVAHLVGGVPQLKVRVRVAGLVRVAAWKEMRKEDEEGRGGRQIEEGRLRKKDLGCLLKPKGAVRISVSFLCTSQ